MSDLKDKIRRILKEGRLKYNYFSCYHPKKSLQCKSFKFLSKNEIQYLQTKKKRKLKDGDLYQGKKKLFYPADGG